MLAGFTASDVVCPVALVLLAVALIVPGSHGLALTRRPFALFGSARRGSARSGSALSSSALSSSAQSGPATAAPRPFRQTALAAGAVLLAAWLIDASTWIVLVAPVAAAIAVYYSYRGQRIPSNAQLRSLAGVFDLLAACLTAGLSLSQSLGSVLSATAATTPADIGNERCPREALEHAAALLQLGAEPVVAWQLAHHHPEIVAMATAAERAAQGGIRLADAARECASDMRRKCLDRETKSAARAGVAITAPLALCFLPAFMCLGLAPVIIGLVGELGIW